MFVVKFRLKKFKAKDWRAGYNALILLEHVLTHGPQSFAEEFEDDLQIFKTMDGFHFLDEKGLVLFNNCFFFFPLDFLIDFPILEF